MLRTNHPSPFGTSPCSVFSSFDSGTTNSKTAVTVAQRATFSMPPFATHGHMTRFVVDTSAVLHLATEGADVPDAHKLLAPTLLRSQTLSALHEAVQRGEIPADVARERLTHIRRLRIRLLGDAVLQR